MAVLGTLSIRTKILSISLVAVIGFIISLSVSYKLNTANAERLQQIQTVYFPVVEASKANIERLERIEELLSTAVSTGEESFIDTAKSNHTEILDNNKQLANTWPEKAKKITEIEQSYSRYFKQALEVSEGMLKGTVDFSLLEATIESMNADLEAAKEQMQRYTQASLDAFNSTVALSNTAAQSALKWSLVVTVLVMALMLIAAWAVGYSINSTLADLLRSLRNIASGEGDLTQRIVKSTDDEIGQVVDSFNLFIEKLHGSIAQLVSSSEPLTRVSSDLHNLIASASKIVTEQNSSTESVTRTIDEIVVSIDQVSSHASLAADAAAGAYTAAQEGSQVVVRTVDSINSLSSEIENAANVIGQLEEFSSNVGNIVNVIRDIAEQTNLLALNAAIEAARAGDQGRGFAVVADEVRTLASRTQASTEEINQVITQLQQAAHSAVQVMQASKEKTAESVEQTAIADERFQAITNQVDSIRSMNQQIADATEQQSQSAAHVREGINAISSGSMQTMTTVQDVEIATETLQQITITLRQVTEQFKV